MIAFRSRLRAGCRGLWPTGAWATPRGLAVRAGLLVAAHLAVHALGWRASMSFLSLTPAPGLDLAGTTARGVVYLVLHLGAVIVAPSLVLAAALLALWNRTRARRTER